MLAETMKTGEYRLSKAWPDEDALSSGDRARLQEVLNRRGHGDLNIDGRLGRESRAAIRSAQASLGYCADGYATASLLDALDRGNTRYARHGDRERETRTDARTTATKTTATRTAAARTTRKTGLFPAQAGTRSRRR